MEVIVFSCIMLKTLNRQINFFILIKAGAEVKLSTCKTVNCVTTYYNTRDGVILSQSDGTNTMYFQYDTNDAPLGFIYNGTQYFYLTNQMGDVLAIADAEGNIIVQYFYDEWGKLLATQPFFEENDENYDEYISVANANPIRYRGYYYDSETGYYYLQSRYYDPSICRFINADIPKIAQMSKDISVGINLFAYCNNDPIDNSDPNGAYPVKLLAYGVQFTLSYGLFTVGLEALWIRGSKQFCAFFFIGGSFNKDYSAIKNSFIKKVVSLSKSIKNSKPNKLGKLSILVSGVAVLGNSYAKFPADYCGWFRGISLVYKHFNASVAFARNGNKRIGSVAFGASTSPFSIGYSKTYYIQIYGQNALKNNLYALAGLLLDMFQPKMLSLSYLI